MVLIVATVLGLRAGELCAVATGERQRAESALARDGNLSPEQRAELVRQHDEAIGTEQTACGVPMLPSPRR
jgi:hypothetical protein